MRAGPLGALAAWVGFTVPSAIALVLFAFGAAGASGPAWDGLLHGLKIVAVAIVAQAVWGMARTLCPDRSRATIAVVAALIVLFAPSSIGQIAAIVLGGLAGLAVCRGAGPQPVGHVTASVSRGTGIAALALFFVLLFLLPVMAVGSASQALAYVDAFYRAGALVFGGAIRGAFLAAFDLPKAVYIFTAGAVGLVIDSGRITAYLWGGSALATDLIWGMFAFIPASFLGAKAAERVVARIPRAKFRSFIAVGLGLIGLRLLFFPS